MSISNELNNSIMRSDVPIVCTNNADFRESSSLSMPVAFKYNLNLLLHNFQLLAVFPSNDIGAGARLILILFTVFEDSGTLSPDVSILCVDLA